MTKKKVLILCTGNSIRSQMAEGLLRNDFDDRFDVFSAGTKPGRVHPEAIAAMQEIGIDISGHRSKHVDEVLGQSFDTVITVCDSAKGNCPLFPGNVRRIHWSFEDPGHVTGSVEERALAFRQTRDRIRSKFRDEVGEIG